MVRFPFGAMCVSILFGFASVVAPLAAGASPAPPDDDTCLDYADAIRSLSRVGVSMRAMDVAADGAILAVACGADGLLLADVADPHMPEVIAVVALEGFARGVAIANGKAFVASGPAGLHIVDIAASGVPGDVVTVDTPGLARDVAVDEDVVFVADGDEGLRLLDTAGDTLATLSLPGLAVGVDASGGLVVVAAIAAGLHVVDASQPVTPVLVSTDSSLGPVEGVALQDSRVYVANGEDRETILDVTVPEDPVALAWLRTKGFSFDVAVSGDRLWIADGDEGLLLFDVSTPESPSAVTRVRTYGTAIRVAVEGGLVFVAEGSAGAEIIDGRPPDAVSITTRVRMPADRLLAHGDLAFVGFDHAGFSVVDLSDPSAPTLRGSVGFPIRYLPIAGMAVHRTTVWVPQSRYTLNSVDVSDPDHLFTGASLESGRTGDAGIVGDHLLLVGDSLTVVDVADSSAPAVVASMPLASFGRHLLVSGAVAYVAHDDGLSVVDVESSGSPSVAMFLPVGRCGGMVAVPPFLYVAAEEVGLRVFDVGDPDAPAPVAVVDSPAALLRVAHFRNTLYATARSDGVFVFDLADPAHPRPRGFVEPPLWYSQTWTNAFDVAVVDGRVWVADDRQLDGIPTQCPVRVDGESGETGSVDHAASRPLIGSRDWHLRGIAPNPSSGVVTLNLTAARTTAVEVTVYDVAGRMVRRLGSGALPSGESSMTWDGRDVTGCRVAPGVYFIQLRGAAATERRKVVLSR